MASANNAKKGANVRMKRKERKNIAAGQAHIQSTFNNTVVTITDLQGNAAVSYTHLDVYKRQGVCRVCFRELAYKGEIPGVKKASW